MIGTLHLGGAEKVVVDLSRELKNRGVDVLICSREGGMFEKKLAGEVSYKIISKKNKNIIHYIRELIELVSKENIEIIHSHMFGNNFFGFIVAKLSGRKIIMTTHGMDCFISKKRRFAYKVLGRYVDRITVVSDYLKDEFNKSINRNIITTVYNGIDIEKFTAQSHSLSKKSELGLSSAFPIVGVVGNIKSVKGYDILTKAVQKVFNIYKGGKLLILGEAIKPNEIQCKKELQEMIRQLNLDDHIVFLGHREDVAEILSILDIYILPSRSEGTSIALLEAMAAGKPIIASKVGGNPRVIKDGVNGFLVPAEDWQTLSDKIITLLKDQDLAIRFGKEARDFVLKNFYLSEMVSNYMKVYEEVLKGR